MNYEIKMYCLKCNKEMKRTSQHKEPILFLPEIEFTTDLFKCHKCGFKRSINH